jgi:two-component system nitrogen regulation response regulator GlnG
VVTIHLPPLRDRREDVPALAAHFLAAFAAEQGRPPKTLSAETLDVLTRAGWPGNVRELENVVKRAAALAPTSLILPDHLPPTLRASAPAAEEPAAADWIRGELQRLQGSRDGGLHQHFLACLERPLFALVLRRTGGNQVKAAELLGINRNTLRKRIRELGVPLPGGEEGAPPDEAS